ncbi:deleted in malignant brain tumors 1 protein-like isoform X2 [Haliotis rubra]|uniref:deleted in malignant brain tumors 1 protein-like isoform X2 n=1 Tax=Haliotis rubra TaxID=36100 RepID=UPI001EE5906C|nr:deleted in malignant brain tumors 1 protein-like isoform X2 [Haliotis rubra]
MAGFRGLFLLLVAVLGQVSLAFYTTTDSSYNRRSSSSYPWNGMATTYPWYGATTDRGTTSDWRYQTSSGSSYGCGTKHSNSLSGYITSPNYPGDYFNNAHCEYIIDPGTYVYLHVVDKNLEPCCDHLVIYDQHDNNVTDTDYLYGRYFRVVFTSDSSEVYRGFKLYYGPDSSYNRRSSSPYPWNGMATTYPWYWSTTDRGWGSRWPYASTEGTTSDWRYQTSSGSSYGCGTKHGNSLSGYITSPNYPGDYFNNARCEYIIDPGTYVYLRVVDKVMESCCDHLVMTHHSRRIPRQTPVTTDGHQAPTLGMEWRAHTRGIGPLQTEAGAPDGLTQAPKEPRRTGDIRRHLAAVTAAEQNTATACRGTSHLLTTQGTTSTTPTANTSSTLALTSTFASSTKSWSLAVTIS